MSRQEAKRGISSAALGNSLRRAEFLTRTSSKCFKQLVFSIYIANIILYQLFSATINKYIHFEPFEGPQENKLVCRGSLFCPRRLQQPSNGPNNTNLHALVFSLSHTKIFARVISFVLRKTLRCSVCTFTLPWTHRLIIIYIK
jgi:hypothetical protein